MAIDPVCRMDIDEEDAEETRSVNGEKVSFCSSECASKFDENPEQYRDRTAA